MKPFGRTEKYTQKHPLLQDQLARFPDNARHPIPVVAQEAISITKMHQIGAQNQAEECVSRTKLGRVIFDFG